MKRVVVGGGGIAGLSTAFHLKTNHADVPEGLEVVLLEASDRVGGNVETHRVDGFTIEGGPNGFLDSVPATLKLVDLLDLRDQIQRADERAARRYLYRHEHLHLLPANPLRFLQSPILSWRGRLRVLAEPFASTPESDVDETIYDFGSRRIGSEAASVLIDAMVSGVFAGNIHELSLASTFPKMAAMEAEHGSLVKAMLATMKERRAAKKRLHEARERGDDVPELTKPGGPAGPRGTLTSFRDGLDTLPRALAAALGSSVHLHCRGEALSYHPDADQPWRVTTRAGEAFAADAVVLALPAPHAEPLLRPLDASLSKTVAEIPSASLAVVALAFDEVEAGGAPDGFGFLAPRREGLRILGCLWDSSVFPGRAPDGTVLLRAMIGGAHDPDAVTLDDDMLVQIVRAELATAMDLHAEPLFTRIFRYPLGIAQYTVGHQQRLDRIHQRLAGLPGLWVAGSSYYGISMNACIEKAEAQAPEITRFLAQGD